MVNILKINWFAKILMRFAPGIFLRYAAWRQGIGPRDIDYAAKLFGAGKRVEIHPLPSSGGRGFVIVLDNRFSLHFYQDGDHFYYDGCEIGEYEKGDVTIFDKL